MTLFKPVFIDQRVTLKPTEFQEAASDIDAHLASKISKELDGQCCSHGYVRPGSVQILARSMGQAEHGRFTGDFLYYCKVRIMCLLPHADQIIEGRILKMNKLGGYALVVDEGRLREAMRILLPRDLHLGNAEFDALEVGQGVRIRLLHVGLFSGPSTWTCWPVAAKRHRPFCPPDAVRPCWCVQGTCGNGSLCPAHGSNRAPPHRLRRARWPPFHRA